MRIWSWPIERASLQTHVSHLEHEIERLQHEYELVRTDYARLVELVGVKSLRPGVANLEIDFDPFQENMKMADEWLQPAEDEMVDVGDLEEKLSGPAVG